MKSKVEKCPVSDAGPPTDDPPPVKVVFDFDELCQAVEEDSVAGLVRAVLRPHCGTSPLFYGLVADITHSVLKALAQRLKAPSKAFGPPHSLTVLYRPAHLERAEAAWRKRQELAGSMSYWRGEGA